MSTYDLPDQLSNLHPDLLSFTRRFTKDRDESLDPVQDTILKALSYSDQFKQNRNLLGWLFIIMRNTFINQYHAFNGNAYDWQIRWVKQLISSRQL